MNGIMRRGAFLSGFLLLATMAAAEDLDIATSDEFILRCPAYAKACDDPDSLREIGAKVVDEMGRIRAWFDDLGIPENERMPREEGRRVLLTGRTAVDVCGENANACHRVDMLSGLSHLWLPVDRLDKIGDQSGTIAHEYLHAHQPDRDAGSANWLREAVATAVGTAWDMKNGWDSGIYPPKYRLSLDLPFHYNDSDDANEDAGYRNWDYLLHLGQLAGSRDHVAYLAKDAFLQDTQYAGGTSAAAMKPFYDAVDDAFGAVFPGYVARFNNLDRYSGEGGNGFYYYAEVQDETFQAESTQWASKQVFEGEVNPYAAAPLRLGLEIGRTGPEADLAASEQLMLAEVEIVDGDSLDDLTLVVEHRLAENRHRTAFLVDGSDPPDELGFYRIVHAPAELDIAREKAGFTLQARLAPVEVVPPLCFQQGVSTSVEIVGEDIDAAGNWRLVTDNGRASGLEITPATAGEISLALEIDSPITRQSGQLGPRKPRMTSVPLGTFPVTADACMIRLTVVADGGGAEAVHTFSFDGEYSEIRADADTAVYLSADDIALYQGGWVHLPPEAKAMVLPALMGGSSIPQVFAPGEDEVEVGGTFLARMPHAFSERFSWAALRRAHGVDGAPVRKSPADCPKEGSGCSALTFAMDGIAVPVILDRQGRPVRVTFEENGARAHMQFEYGSWAIRRPPGW